MSPLDEAVMTDWHAAASVGLAVLLAMSLSLAAYGLWALRR